MRRAIPVIAFGAGFVTAIWLEEKMLEYYNLDDELEALMKAIKHRRRNMDEARKGTADVYTIMRQKSRILHPTSDKYTGHDC